MSTVTYHHSGLLEVQDIQDLLRQVSYKGWGFNCYLGYHEGVHLQILTRVPNAYGADTVDLDIHCRVPRVARRDEEHFLDWLLERLQVAENHETREFFKVGGLTFNSPHREHADRDVV